MNKTVSLRDDVLAAIDSIDNVVTESEIDVLVSMLGATDKAVSIMENYSGDELGSFGIFMEDGENNSGNEKKDESVLKSIVMLPIRLLQSLWKLITGQFNKESVETTKAAAMKVEDVEPGVFNSLLGFFKSGDGGPDVVKIAGLGLAASLLVGFKSKFKTAVTTGTDTMKNTFSAIRDKCGMRQDMVNDFVFEVSGEGDNKSIKTNISLQGCSNFVHAAVDYITHPNKLQVVNNNKKDLIANINGVLTKPENWVLTKDPNTYAFTEFITMIEKIQNEIGAAGDQSVINSATTVIRDGNQSGDANDREEVAKEFGKLCEVLTATVKMLVNIQTQYKSISDAITQAAEQINQQQQQAGQNQPGDPNNPQQTGPNNPPQTQPGSGGPLYTKNGNLFKFNNGGSTTDRLEVTNIFNNIPGIDYDEDANSNIDIIDNNNGKSKVTSIEIDKLPKGWEKVIDPSCRDFIVYLDNDKWVAKDQGRIANPNDPFALKKNSMNAYDIFNEIDWNSIDKSKIQQPTQGDQGPIKTKVGKAVTTITDTGGFTYLWTPSKNNPNVGKYVLDRNKPPTTTTTYPFETKKRYTAQQIIDIIKNSGIGKTVTWRVVSANNMVGVYDPAKKTITDLVKNGKLSKDAEILVFRSPKDFKDYPIIEPSKPFELINRSDPSKSNTTLTSADIDALRPNSKGYIKPQWNKTNLSYDYFYEYDVNQMTDSDELVQEEFEVDPVASTWYSK